METPPLKSKTLPYPGQSVAFTAVDLLGGYGPRQGGASEPCRERPSSWMNPFGYCVDFIEGLTTLGY